MSADGAETRMKAISNRVACGDRDGIGLQVIIDRIAHGVARPGAGEVHVRDLAKRMNARVGAPGALRNGLITAKPLNGMSQRGLDGRTVGLDLPADERCSVVFNVEAVAGHRIQIAALAARANSAVTAAPFRHAATAPPKAHMLRV